MSKKEEAARQQEITELLEQYRLGTTAPVPEANQLISIDRVRQLRAEMGFKPTVGRYRVVIVLDVDRMKPEGANAFLKTLEEPQQDTVFILTTTRSHSLPVTIRSRCQTITFSRLSPEAIVEALTRRLGPAAGGAERYAMAAAVAEGSLKSAFQFISEPDEFLDPDAVDFFANPPRTDERLLALAGSAERGSLQPFIASLVFLYRHALEVKLGMSSPLRDYDRAIRAKAAALSNEAAVRILGTLLRAQRESEYYVNPKIFLFSLISSLG